MLPCLSTNSESLDNRAITLDVLFNQVVKQTTTLTNHLQQSTTGMMIFFMHFEMLGQISDPLGQKCNLNFWGAGVTFVSFKILNDFLFTVSSKQLLSPFPYLILEAGIAGG
jgi:hypothetical protein